jgi:hypothetical protein
VIQAPGQVFDAAGDVLASGEPEQAHDDVAGGGQELGRCAGSDLGPVLVERPVADVIDWSSHCSFTVGEWLEQAVLASG